MKAQRFLALSLAGVLALALAGCGSSGGSGSADSGAISVAGSDTMVNLANSWQEAYTATNDAVMISVKGGGSGTGIAALLNGTVDFANASRELKDEEKQQAQSNGIDPVSTAVAKDSIAVIVNPANTVEGLTLDQLGKIYRGELTNWKDVGGPDEAIVLLSRDTASGTYEFFKESVVGKEAEYAKSARLLSSSQQIVDEVKANPAAIGYVGMGYESADIKILEVDGTAATVDAVLDGSYVLSRDLYMISNGQPQGAMKAYLDWIVGAEGQKIVADQGFVPLSK